MECEFQSRWRLWTLVPVICLTTLLTGSSTWAASPDLVGEDGLEWLPAIEVDSPALEVQFADSQELALADEEGESENLILPTAFWASPISSEWQILPQGLLYSPYLAGEKEPRFASQWLWEKDRGRIWEAEVGGRWGLVRHGTPGIYGQGFQFDVEGAAFVRIDPEHEADLEGADFRAGFVGTWRNGRWRTKAGYYHLSSHAGDEYLLANPGFHRINYVRDSLLLGIMYDVTPNFQVYTEFAGALNANGGAQFGEIQIGAQYAPAQPTGIHGAPFAAINGHLRQDFNFGGSVNVEAGWAWRGRQNGHLFRVGVQHYNGPALQWEFFDNYESLTGISIWFDF